MTYTMRPCKQQRLSQITSCKKGEKSTFAITDAHLKDNILALKHQELLKQQYEAPSSLEMLNHHDIVNLRAETESMKGEL